MSNDSALAVPPAIVIDGDVSPQRLEALIDFCLEQNSERDELEVKRNLSLQGGRTKEKLELVADIVAMAGGIGGYIVIGVEEIVDSSGRRMSLRGFEPSEQTAFDVSTLRQVVEHWVEVRIDLRLAIVRSVRHNGCTYGLICVMPCPE